MKTIFTISAIAAATISLTAFIIETPPSSTSGIEIHNMDKTVKPTDDFFLYVNGNWVKNNPIPASESSWGSFKELHEKNTQRLATILKEVAADKTAKPGSNVQKIRDFYNLAMDSVKLNKERATPLNSEFEQINNITNTTDLLKEVAHLHSIGVESMFSAFVDQDPKISTEYITQLYQGGIGLPDRDYYTNTDDRTLGIQKAYIEHIESMFKLLGDKPETAKKNAKIVFDMETNLAKASMTQIELRDPQKQYNKKTMQELNELAPDFQFATYFDGVNIKGISNVIVAQPEFFKQLNNDMKSVSIANWKTYLRWSLINHTANRLSDDFVNQNFKFYGNTLVGIPTLKLRWKRALEATDGSLGDALGQLFVKKYFTEESKRRVNEMVDNLIAAYRVRINSRDWMSEETKKQAQLKLDKIIRKLGYPDEWKDYSTLDIKTDAYVANFFRANNYKFKEMINRLGKPIDRKAWMMT
ncbi:MAG TPA: M13 family metallopeptidase, partial [Bacteroidia bacterium]|nr:M13 family metallopeptidase [Bacteroidia bacterium]